MASAKPGRSSLEELELTGEEAERLCQAFQDDGFRKLFAEYAAELADPGQRAIYEAEVAALERQRGVEARFLHPEPGWVLRTSQQGNRRCYLNICSNPLVGRPEARPEPGRGGSAWSLPHCLAPGREELRRGRPRGPHRLVYDVLFHPDALRLAARSPRFRRLVDETALEAVERHFAPGLDRANAARLRGPAKYVGVPQAALLRTPLPGGPPPAPPEGDCPALPPFPTPYAYPPPEPEREAGPPAPPPPAPEAATPRWTLRQRSYVDLQDYRQSRDSAPSPVPRELVVTVELPLLRSAASAQLEVRGGRELQLDSPRPAAYRLRLRLPYPVDEGGGRAAFNKAKRQLVVTLPVLAQPPRPGLDLASPQEEKEEEEEEAPPARPGAGSPEEAAAAATLPAPEPRPATHVAAGSEVSPECAPVKAPASSGPPTEGSDLPPRLAAPPPASPAKSPALPALAEDAGSPVPGAAAAAASSGETSSPELPAPSTAGGHVDLRVGGLEAGSVPLPASPCAGTTVDLPGTPSTSRRRLGPPVGQPHPPNTDMDRHHQCHSVTPLLSPSQPEPCAHRLCCECSSLDQDRALSPNARSPVPPPCPPATGQADLAAPALCPRSGAAPPAAPPLLPSTETDALPAPVPCPGSSVSPDSPAPPLCPPFHCMQDEQALTLLLQVPGVIPQSLKGEVGTNHYRVSFDSEDSAAYTILLQFLPENKLTPPESEVSVSPNNVVIVLTKSPETTGLWTKLCFGPNVHMLQEMWFVTKNNVDKFLNGLPSTSCSSQSEMEEQPLIEVLDISEGKSQIRLKQAQEPDKTEPKRESGEQDNGSKLSTDAENCLLVQPERASGLRAAMETMGQVGKGPSHCLGLDSHDPSSAIPQESQRHDFHESELAFPASKIATSTTPAQLSSEQPAQTGEEGEIHSEGTENKQGRASRPAPPVIKETNMQDGSVQYISHHATHCAVTFQNALLYELD